MTLDVHNLYGRLTREFGDEAVDFGPMASRPVVRMVGRDGSPLYSGWFFESADVLAVSQHHHALTSILPNAQTVNHRLTIDQPARRSDGTVVKEGYCDDLLKWHDLSSVKSEQPIEQPALGELVREIAAGALVLGQEAGDKYDLLCHELSLEALREYGLGLRARDAGLGYIVSIAD